jgi:hypothetical protein
MNNALPHRVNSYPKKLVAIFKILRYNSIKLNKNITQWSVIGYAMWLLRGVEHPEVAFCVLEEYL